MSDYNFNPELACKIGVDEAIMMQNLVFWIKKNKANNKHFYDGRYWTYNSIEAFVELFPFWTGKQLRRIMQSLYDQDVILKGNYNKSSFDKTGWYAITDTYDYLLVNYDLPKRAVDIPQMGSTIPYSKQDSKTDINKEELIVGETPTLFNDSLKQPEAKEDKKEERAREKSFDERAQMFVDAFNKVVNRKYKATTKVKQALKQRLKSYSSADILKAVTAASKHQFHVDNNFQYLTPAYILREDILERYLNAPVATAAQSTSTEIVLQ